MIQSNSILDYGHLTSMKMMEVCWLDIEYAFKEGWLVVIPLGASCKEHGYHLPMNTDLIIANKMADFIFETYKEIIIAPPITDSYFPAFVEYPGSSTLSLDTARDMIVQKCQLWHNQGANKFYVLNIGISTNAPLSQARVLLKENSNIIFEYLDLLEMHQDPRLTKITEQKVGTHADELETSMMLYLAPEAVHLEKAIPEVAIKKGPLTRDPLSKDKTISISGAWGDPTLATIEKGKLVVSLLEDFIDKQLSLLGIKKK